MGYAGRIAHCTSKFRPLIQVQIYKWLTPIVNSSAALYYISPVKSFFKVQSPLLVGCLEQKHEVTFVAFMGHASSAI